MMKKEEGLWRLYAQVVRERAVYEHEFILKDELLSELFDVDDVEKHRALLRRQIAILKVAKLTQDPTQPLNFKEFLDRVEMGEIKPAAPRNRLDSAVRFAGWIPWPMMRKTAKKLLADQAAHIAELEAAGQFRAARWQKWATWGLLLQTLFAGIPGGLLSLLSKARTPL
jgi:hypothetical protein